MKLTTILLFVFCMQLSATVHSQITLSEKNAPITLILEKIQQQSGYNLFYKDKLVNDNRLNISLKNVSLEKALDEIFRQQNLDYELVKKTIIIKQKEPSFLDRVVDALTPPVNVSGVVLDEKGAPLAGATVRVKGLKISVVTDKEGKFYMPGVDDKAVLLISYVGYKELEVLPRMELTVRLELLNKDLEEVVIAYGKTTKQALIGAVTVVNGDQIASQPNRSLDKSLQGLVPGLLVTNGTGQPGGGVSNMVLRGISSGSDGLRGSTARNPLFVIDGVPVDQNNTQYEIRSVAIPVTNPMAQINPAEVESITVLKDAAAIALYGSKASNGVILITTKKGKAGTRQVSFSNQYDLSFRPQSAAQIVNREQYMELLYEAYRNSTPGMTDAAILSDLYLRFPTRMNGSEKEFYDEPNWYDVLYQDAAPTLTSNLSLSGGGDYATFRVNAEHLDQKGIVRGTGYQRSSLNMNLNTRPAKFLELSNITSLSYNVQDVGSSAETWFSVAQTLPPFIPVRDANGAYIFNFPYTSAASAVPNPAVIIEFNRNRTKGYRGLSSFKAELKFLKYFKLASTAGVNFMVSENYQKSDPRINYNMVYGEISEFNVRRANLIANHILSFDKMFGKQHGINFQLGQESQIFTDKNAINIYRGTVASLPYYNELGSPGYTQRVAQNINSRQSMLSQFSQLQYGFRQKYYLSGSYRRDGSSLFGSKQQWGSYWSTGAGWIVSSEPFMKSLEDYISYLKIRGSFGAAGNSANVKSLSRYNTLTDGQLNGQLAVVPATTPANSNIKWERTFSWDAGLELRLLNDRISLTADIYKKYTADLIYRTNLAAHTGYLYVDNNIGDLSNRGTELSLNAQVLKGKNFRWTVDGSWSINRNVLVKAYVPIEILSGVQLANEEGRNYNSFYMPVWAGVNPVNGAPLWKANDGGLTSLYANAKKEFVGKPQPDGFGSLTNKVGWKGLELAVQLYYQYGFQLYRSVTLMTDGITPYNRQSTFALNRWQQPGDIVANPLRRLNNTAGSTSISTRYLSDGDFLKIQQASLSYAIPRKLLDKLHLSNLRVFAQGYNLFYWSLAKDANPDNASVSGLAATTEIYPIARSYSFGVNLTL